MNERIEAGVRMGLNDLQSTANTWNEKGGEGAAKQLTKREAINESKITHGYCILGAKKGNDGKAEKLEKEMKSR